MMYQTAFKYALDFTDALRPLCEKIMIAGSVRRMSANVKDIDIVAIPKDGHITAFFTEARKHGLAKNKTERDTRYFKLEVNDRYRFSFDIFLPRKYDWGRQLAIRTGPADYSAYLASLWSAKGYSGTQDGLLPKGLCHLTKSGDWKINPGIDPVNYRVEFLEEVDFFNWLGIDMHAAELRKR